MTRYFHRLMITGFITLCLAACTRDNKWANGVATTITPVEYISDDTSLNIDQLGNEVLSFDWEKCVTGNNTLVFYQLLFDKENGDFSTPIHTITPGTGGTQNNVVLTHRDLNRIAAKAGIAQLQAGKIKWRVTASTGVVKAESGNSRLIQLQRPAGYAENPADVFLTGTATEAGTNPAQAIKFKKITDGVFELYSSLSAGTYQFIDKITGTPLSFVLNGVQIKDGTDGNSPATVKTAYRIRLDFNTALAEVTEIVEVGLWFAGYNTITDVLSYNNGGVWKAANIPIVWSVQSWGKDERYKFRVREKDSNGVITDRFWGSSKIDNIRPISSTAASYYYFISNDNSRWDYTYKFEKEAAQADVLVKFQAANPYTHQVIYY